MFTNGWNLCEFPNDCFLKSSHDAVLSRQVARVRVSVDQLEVGFDHDEAVIPGAITMERFCHN